MNNKSVIFAMRYRQDIGYVWSYLAKLYNMVAQKMLPDYISYIAYPELSGGMEEFAFLNLIEYDFYKSIDSNLHHFINQYNIKMIVFFGCDPRLIDINYYKSKNILTVNLDGDSYPQGYAQSVFKRIAKTMIRKVLRCNIHDLYIANANHQRDFLINNACLPPERVVTIPNGIDTGHYTPGILGEDFRRNIIPADHYVISVCQARPEKRIDFFIDIAHNYIEKYKNMNVVFCYVGSGSELKKWIDKAKSMNLGAKFIFFGKKDELSQYYKLASVYVHCAERESFGNTIIEAMSSGLPVVSYGAPGPREILEKGTCGTVIDCYDVNLFVDAIHSYLSSKKLRAFAGNNGRNMVCSLYSIERQANDIAKKLVTIEHK